MTDLLSLQLASILGPLLIALSITEYRNFDIWKDAHPTLVYLNGLILLTGGLIIIQLHNRWVAHWMVLVTLIGWLLMLAGLYRMIFPSAKQAEKGLGSTVLLSLLFTVGLFLSVKAFLV